MCILYIWLCSLRMDINIICSLRVDIYVFIVYICLYSLCMDIYVFIVYNKQTSAAGFTPESATSLCKE